VTQTTKSGTFGEGKTPNSAERVGCRPRESSTGEDTAAARTGTGDDGRGELAAAVTSRGPVGAKTLKPALIPC
jgi:hypothetical protein